MTRRRLPIPISFVLVTLLSCVESPLDVPVIGGVEVKLVDAAGAPLVLTLENVKIVVARSEASPRTVTLGATNAATVTARVDSLEPGTYSIEVQGLVGGELDHFGRLASIEVTAGNVAVANVPVTSFRPVITTGAATDTTEVLRYTVAYGAVAGASSYIVRWSTSPTFADAQTRAVTGTSTEIALGAEGKYYVSVRAVNSAAPSGGRPSDAKLVAALQAVAAVTVTPATQTLAAGATQQFAAVAKDADGATVAGAVFFWASSNHAVATISPAGLVTAVGGGEVSITAVGRGTPGSATLTVTPAAPAKLVFSVQPTSIVAGEPLSPAVQVEIQDAAGKVIKDARNAVTVAIETNGGGGTLGGTKVVNAINGIASFSGLWINKTGTGYTLKATSGDLTASTSTAFAVSHAPAAKLLFLTQPTEVEGNVTFGATVAVRVADQFDNTVTSSTAQVTLSLGANPWRNIFSFGGSLLGTKTVAAVEGVAIFASVKVDKPGDGYTLVANSGALAAATSAPFRVKLTVQQIAAGDNHTCAITVGGTYCWGDNGSGQLGTPELRDEFDNDSIPVLVSGPQRFVSITAGTWHTCGLTADGKAFCWGDNVFGQLGNGSTSFDGIPTPVPAAADLVFAKIDAGGATTCGVTTANAQESIDRQVYCWGSNEAGMLGIGSPNTQFSVAQRVAEPLRSVKAVSVSVGGGGFFTGGGATCAVDVDKKAYCWGTWDLLGDGTPQPPPENPPFRDVPGLVAGGYQWLSLHVGRYQACGIVADNSARCWGSGSVGSDAALPVLTPTLVQGGMQFTAIGSGMSHVCGLTSAGAAHCWGSNQYGQLGTGVDDAGSAGPVAVTGSHTFLEIVTGEAHSCGRTAVALYCWGANWSGQLGSPGGVGFNTVRRSPTQIIQ